MERSNREHVKEEELESYAMNSMAEDDVAVVEEHLLFCKACQEQLEQVERYVLAMQSAAKRIREEESQAPVTPGAWDRLRAWFHTPVPIWTGAVAMACVILMVGLHVGERPGPPIDVELHAVRGPVAGTAEAGHALHLRLDNRGVPEMKAWRIEIVNENGSKVWTGTGSWTDTAILASVDKSFRPGTYFVRLMKDGEDPVREYELIVKKPAA